MKKSTIGIAIVMGIGIILIFLSFLNGCITPDDPEDLRPPLMNTNDFQNFDKPDTITNTINTTNCA